MGLINVENKVISSNMLMKIFRGVQNTYNDFMQLSEKEKQENSLLEEENQRWTFFDKGSECVVNVYFLNGDHKRYHEMSEFISEYKAQGGLMETVQLRLSLFYQATDVNMYIEMMLTFGFLIIALLGAFLIIKGGIWLFGRIGKTEEQKKKDEQYKKDREKRDAAIQEQYEKFAREYGGYYFYRIFKKVYPYSILKYYEPIMPDRLRTDVKGLRVNIQWDIERFIKQSEICLGKGVDKAYCRVEVEKRVKVAGITLLTAIVAVLLTILIVLIFGDIQGTWQMFWR